MNAPSDAGLVSALKIFSRIAGVAAVLVGALVLAGWALDIGLLKSLRPEWMTMKANTALGFMLAGVSLWFARRGTAPAKLSPASPWLRRVCAGAVALIGALTLSQYLFGWNLGVDQLLFQEPPGAVVTSHPGRMAPTTAFNFLMLGLALLFIEVETRDGARPAQSLGLAVGAVALFALVGYLYDTELLYGVAAYTEMALHTAIGFLALGLGVLAAHPERGWMARVVSTRADGYLLRRLVPAALPVPVFLGWLGLMGQRAGLYDTEIDAALVALVSIVILLFILWITAATLEALDRKRRQAEEALQRANEALETRVAERTGELSRANEQLARDIAERKRAEDALRASEAHLHTIIEAEPECVHLVGSGGVLKEMNAAGLAMIEAEGPQQVLGQSVYSLVTPDYRAAYRALTERVLQGGTGALEFEIVGLKGTHRWMETRAVPLKGPDGETQMLGITRDITEQKNSREQLIYLAHYDDLTGLPNRVLFGERLEQAMSDAERHERLVAVVFVDLDRFKNVNDTLGHAVGDQMLKDVTERLLGVVRRGDTVARLSGDEFTIVLADMAHVDDASRVARKILDVFAQPFHIAGRDLFMSVSLGITIFPFDTRDAGELLRNADIAMYRAKDAGRSTYQFYAAEMTAKATEAMALEDELRHALERGEFLLHYQPIVDRGGNILGAEALLRWQHPEHGLVPPLQFIPLAEETGLILPIGEWVLRQACTQARAWRGPNGASFHMSVNVSPRQFRHSGLMQTVETILEEAGLDPKALNIEITESILMQQETLTRELFSQLSGRGISFSIDDFGTGYSSLSYLKRFPIDYLKIDQSFVRDVTIDPDDAALAQAIISMAHSLGMQTVAEGVETWEQRAFLLEHGCDAMQGYYFSRPIPSEAFAALLATGKPLPGNSSGRS